MKSHKAQITECDIKIGSIVSKIISSLRQPRIESGSKIAPLLLPQTTDKLQGMAIEPTTSAVLKPRHKQLDHPCCDEYTFYIFAIPHILVLLLREKTNESSYEKMLIGRYTSVKPHSILTKTPNGFLDSNMTIHR